MRVNAVAYFRVIDPNKAVTEVENFLLATSQIAQTTLRSVLGKAELDALLSERERLNIELQQIIDEQTEPWGVKVTTVEVKDVELPADMQRAIARQAEAERERRAKIISADGEFQAAREALPGRRTSSALNPATLQLRYLQTLLDIGVNQNSTIIFPLPLDMIKPFLGFDVAGRRLRRSGRATPRGRRTRRTPISATCGPGERPRGPDRPAHRPARDPGAGPGRAPGRVRGASRAGPRGRRGQTCPFCEGREDRTPPEVWARRPGGGEPDSPGWTARSVPNLYPVLGTTAAGGQPRARDGRRRASRAPSIRSVPRRAPETRPVRLTARRRRARGDRPRPRARDLADRARRGALRRRGRGLARADAGARRAGRLRPPDRQRGPRRGRLARALARAALRDALRPRRGRPRARAGRRLPPADDGRAPALRRRDRGGAPLRAAGRDRRRGAARLPVGVAAPVRASGDPAAPGRRRSRTTARSAPR